MKRISGPTASVLLYSAMGLQPAYADADWDRYATSSYEYCDAVILGSYWGESVSEAKTTIGRKLGWGNADIVASDIAQARGRGERCEFGDTGFDYSDAEAVAVLWGSSVVDAKVALTEKVSVGQRDYALQLVAEARSLGRESRPPASSVNHDAEIDRYVNSHYEYCDAVMLGAFWGESAYEAKISIGQKLGDDNVSGIESALSQTRDRGVRCEFGDTGLNYADAQLLAGYWGLDIIETKARLADKVSMGERAMAESAIAVANELGGRRKRY